ncbi:hypothetical protein N0Z98_28515, partial [Pseudomonas aeruginosa]|nr:hypothetical protein [Pseudomonas aeruginosa]MCS7604734.1 hypothetical protein [Pseudomonas aeruginosa]
TKSLSLPLYPTIFSLYPPGLSHSLSLWAQKANLDRAVSRHWIGQAGMSVGPVDAQAATDYQETADFLLQTGALPKPFDTSTVIDTSFNEAFH